MTHLGQTVIMVGTRYCAPVKRERRGILGELEGISLSLKFTDESTTNIRKKNNV